MVEKIKVLQAKGRPMLQWIGKKPLEYVKSFPTQLIETFNTNGQTNFLERPTYEKLKENWTNLIFHGDNLEVMGYLLENGFRGKIDLIYIDPPFDSKADYIRKIDLRGISKKVNGEDYTLGEQLQYYDIWANDAYLQFMYERLLALKELLSDKGVIFLHCDAHRNAYLRLIMDEVFGSEHFVNEITWQSSASGKTTKKMLPDESNTIYLYSKTENYKLNEVFMPLSETTKAMYKFDDGNGRGKYRLFPLQKTGGPGPETTYDYVDNNGKKWKCPPKGWRMKKSKLKALENDGRLLINGTTIGEKAYWNERKNEGKSANNLWVDIANLQGNNPEMTQYPTQKPEKLLNRIIEIGSSDGDLVFDAFGGCGTTSAVAQKLKRKWILVDINKGAIQATSNRIQKIMKEQIKQKQQKKLISGEKELVTSFAHYKINDYDLQLLRTEAIELAIQHLGIEKTKTDSFFDGIIGTKLVKIIDFNHPLTLLDLQLIQDELKKRPDENRDITIVCLGKEIVIDDWVFDYNKKHPLNKINIIELRTDNKYGRFLIHKPDEAEVKIKRNANRASIEITNFISPSILQRLNNDEKLVKIKIPNFKSMIDVVLIDTNYNGKTFNIAFSDVPEKKNDLISGKYDLEISKKKTKIAVKIIDMLGEEILVTKEL